MASLRSRDLKFGDLPENALTSALSYLDRHGLSAPSASCRYLRLCAEEDDIWREFYLAKWKRYRRGREWCDSAAVRAAAASSAGSARSGLWKRIFIADRHQARFPVLPIFAMHARLAIGRSFGMHFFEPRYRWLVRRAVDASADHPQFCYCTTTPRDGGLGYVCGLLQPSILPDGRANVGVLPQARYRLLRVWTEPVPGAEEAPPLTCAEAEELPMRRQLPIAPNSGVAPSSASSAANEGHRERSDAPDEYDEIGDDDEDDDDDDDEDDDTAGDMRTRRDMLHRIFQLLEMARAGGAEDGEEGGEGRFEELLMLLNAGGFGLVARGAGGSNSNDNEDAEEEGYYEYVQDGAQDEEHGSLSSSPTTAGASSSSYSSSNVESHVEEEARAMEAAENEDSK